MPATSKAQQRLMGMAYAYKKGELDSKEASQEVKDLADSMTLKQLKKYAATKHEGLPDKVDDNLQPGDVGGMGPIKFPTATEYGSGDVPAGQGDAEEEYKKKRRKMKHLKSFESFVNNSLTESRAPKTKEELISALDDAYSKLDKYNTKYYEISTAPGGGSWSSNSREGKKALKYKKMADNQQSNIWKWTDKLRKLGFEYDSKK